LGGTLAKGVDKRKKRLIFQARAARSHEVFFGSEATGFLAARRATKKKESTAGIIAGGSFVVAVPL